MAKTTIKTRELKNALTQVGYLNKRTTLPITNSTLLSVSDSKCVLKSTDLERYVKVVIPAEGDNFEGMIPKRQLSKFVFNGDGCTAFSYEKENLLLEREDIGKLSFCKPPKPADFPPEPLINPESVAWYMTDAKWFCRMVGIVSQACAYDDGGRPIIHGVLFHDGAIAAADGFRLYVFKDNKLNFGLNNLQAIIHRQTLDIVRKIFSKSDSLKIGFEKYEDTKGLKPETYIRNVIFSNETTTLICNTILGKFTEYNQLIPASFTTKVTFSSPLMSQRLQLIDDREVSSGITRFQLSQDEKRGDVCLLSAGIEELLNYSISLPVKVEGDRLAKIAMNFNYVLNAIKPFSICNMEFNTHEQPVKFTGDIEGLTAVVMPIYVQW